MPELPEVETVKNQLAAILVGKTVKEIRIHDAKVADTQLESLTPFTVESVSRRGKWIVIQTNKKSLLAHLRMTGHFLHGTEVNLKYCAAEFHLDDETVLTHHSVRRFGGIDVYTKKQLDEKLAKQGAEPLEIDQASFVTSIWKSPRANIKNKLLDQHFLAGVGNIYAQEALHHAQIHPERIVSEVPEKKLQKLHKEIQRILRLSIANNGTTVRDYGHIDGKGDFQHLLSVYTKEKCPQNHSIHKIKIAGRGTYYCPTCQR